MIKVNKKEQVITISGHANWGAFGKDIVCAAVSSVVYTTVNAIMKYSSRAIRYEDQNDKMTITILEKDEITNLLIANMFDILRSLEEDYPHNISVKEN